MNPAKTILVAASLGLVIAIAGGQQPGELHGLIAQHEHALADARSAHNTEMKPPSSTRWPTSIVRPAIRKRASTTALRHCPSKPARASRRKPKTLKAASSPTSDRNKKR